MVDPVQRTSSQPVPVHQTAQSTQNPLPLNSRAELARVDDVARTADADKKLEGFRDFLNQTSITTLEAMQRDASFDPAADISAGSVYAPPPDRTPI